VKQGVATRNSNKVTDAILSDKPWLLRDPLKGGLLGTLLDVPASVFTGWLTNKATAPVPKDSPPIPQLPKETPLPPNWWENMNNFTPNNEDIQNSLILNKF
jgi:hypothetical protein